MPRVYSGVATGRENIPLEEHEVNLLERISDQGGAVRMPVIEFKSLKPKDAEALKAMIDTLRDLEQRGYVLAEVDDARSEIRVSLLEPSIMLLEARNCLKGQKKE